MNVDRRAHWIAEISTAKMPVVIRPALTDVIALKESGGTAMFVLKKASAPVCIEK